MVLSETPSPCESRRSRHSTRACRRKYYGGTERVVSYLTEELVATGHDVTLFASGDSVDPGPAGRRLRAGAPARQARRCDQLAHHVLMLERGRPSRAREFDVDPLPRRLPRTIRCRGGSSTPHLTTLHGRLDLPDLAAALPRVPRRAARLDLRRPAPAAAAAQLVGTVYHGLPSDLYRFRPSPGEYLPSSAASRRRSGRTARSRSPRRARHAAQDRGQGRPASTATTSSSEIGPLLDDPLVEYVGEIGEREKDEFLGTRGAAVPDRLARAVRPGDDRGDGLRHAGHRLPPRLRARGHRDGRTGFIVEDTDESGRRGAPARRARPRTRAAQAFEQRFTRAAHGRRTTSSSIGALDLTANAATGGTDMMDADEILQVADQFYILPTSAPDRRPHARAEARRHLRRLRPLRRHPARRALGEHGIY